MTTQDETVVDTTPTAEPVETTQEELDQTAEDAVSQEVVIDSPTPPWAGEANPPEIVAVVEEQAPTAPTAVEEVVETEPVEPNTQEMPTELSPALIAELRVIDPNQTIR